MDSAPGWGGEGGARPGGPVARGRAQPPRAWMGALQFALQLGVRSEATACRCGSVSDPIDLSS